MVRVAFSATYLQLQSGHASLKQRTALEALVATAPQQQEAVEDGPFHAYGVQLMLQEVHVVLHRRPHSRRGHRCCSYVLQIERVHKR